MSQKSPEQLARKALAQKTWTAKNREASRRIARKSKLKRVFGLSLEDYDQMLLDQCNACAICEMHQSELKKALAVDHCHTTGKIRGLLCETCNTALGKFRDDPLVLRAAIIYLGGLPDGD